MKPLTIGKVAKLAGVGVETVRFYERKGLIDKPPTKDSGYRQYGEDVVGRISFIRRAKDLGFSLKEIQELLRLRVEPGATCADVRARAMEKIADVDKRIEQLSKIKSALEKLAASCRGRGPSSDCPILEALDREE
ncbi:MAG: heavy metal-responsive transcriptional regulator [Candidatus Nitrospinota bacterium M3_3B_026]